MKKNDYQKPTMNVVKIQQTQMLCSSPSPSGSWDAIGQGDDNAPPGARRRRDGRDDWDE